MSAASPTRDGPDTLPGALRVFASWTSPRLLALIVVVAWTTRALLGAPGRGDFAVAAAILLFWPLQEWLIHVFILHYRPRRFFGRTLDFEVPRKHRAHHAEPWRQQLIFIPLHVYVYVPFALGALAWWGASTVAVTGAAVYFTLALYYEWIHFLVHTRVRPRSAFYRRLWRNHRHHHFKNENYWFGVTMLSGDRLLGTRPDVEDTPRSATVRTLGLDEGELT